MSKVPTYGVSMVSVLRIEIMVWRICFIFGHWNLRVNKFLTRNAHQHQAVSLLWLLGSYYITIKVKKYALYLRGLLNSLAMSSLPATLLARRRKHKRASRWRIQPVILARNRPWGCPGCYCGYGCLIGPEGLLCRRYG